MAAVDADASQDGIRQACEEFLSQHSVCGADHEPLAGLYPANDAQLSEFLAAKKITWFQLKGVSVARWHSLQSEEGARIDFVRALDFPALFDAGLKRLFERGLFSEKNCPGMARFVEESMKEGRPLHVRTCRYLQELAVEYEECFGGSDASHGEKRMEMFTFRRHPTLLSDLVRGSDIATMLAPEVMERFFERAFDRKRIPAAFMGVFEGELKELLEERLLGIVELHEEGGLVDAAQGGGGGGATGGHGSSGAGGGGAGGGSGRMADVLYHVACWFVRRTGEKSRKAVLARRIRYRWERDQFRKCLDVWLDLHSIGADAADADALPTRLVKIQGGDSREFASRELWGFVCEVEEFVRSWQDSEKVVLDGIAMVQLAGRRIHQMDWAYEAFVKTCRDGRLGMHGDTLVKVLFPDLIDAFLWISRKPVVMGLRTSLNNLEQVWGLGLWS